MSRPEKESEPSMLLGVLFVVGIGVAATMAVPVVIVGGAARLVTWARKRVRA